MAVEVATMPGGGLPAVPHPVQLVTTRVPILALVMVVEAMVPVAKLKRPVTPRLVELAFVNTPVLGVAAPIGVLSIDPPVMVSDP